MKRILALLVTAISIALFFGCSPKKGVEKDITETDEGNGGKKTDPVPFTLTCELMEGKTIRCILRNVSNKPVHYSDYTIGYWEDVLLERYDPARKSWENIPGIVYPNGMSVFGGIKSAGPSKRSIKEVLSGEIVPPERHEGGKVGYSFIVNLHNYPVPEDTECRLRVTQILDLPTVGDVRVWNGRITSKAINFDPNKKGLDGRQVPSNQP